MKRNKNLSIFRSAIDDGEGMVDSGYYGMVLFTYLAIFAVTVMICGLSVQCYFDQAHKFDALMLGQGIGLVASAYALYIGAVGAFKRLDRDPQVKAAGGANA